MIAKKAEWLRKSGLTTKRRTHTVNGNPRFWVTFADGTRFPTANDAQVGYPIENPEYQGDVLIYVERGAITDIKTADPEARA